MPDQDLPDISSLPLLNIYPLASAQYACEKSQNSAKTRWFFDIRSNLSDIFDTNSDDNSVSTLETGEYLCQTRNTKKVSSVRLNVPECKFRTR
jgi:hypothetical protein